MRRFVVAAAVIAAVAIAAPAFAGDHVRVIVGFNGAPDNGLFAAHGGSFEKALGGVNAAVGFLPPGSFARVKADLNVAYVEEDGVKFAVGKPAKPPVDPPPPPPEAYGWGVDRIDAEVVHTAGLTGLGVRVAIIDTGIDLDHPDLAAVVVNGPNFVNPAASSDDDNGHGSHVAGIVAAQKNELAGSYVGVAPGATLIALKVLSASGSGSTSGVIDAIEWASGYDPNDPQIPVGPRRADVINMSLGSSSYSEAENTACANAYGNGLLVVAAAGNEARKNSSPTSYPAGYESVASVAATDSRDVRASFSNFNADVELAAPGVSIPSTYKNGGYATLSGTSMASPHVAGLGALLMGQSLSAGAARARMIETVTDLGTAGWDRYYGWGLIDAEKALLGTTVGDN